MARLPELDAGSPSELPARTSQPVDWVRLFGCAAAGDALDEIAHWLGPDVVELSVVRGAPETIAWRREDAAAVAEQVRIEVAGDPPWRLGVGVGVGCTQRPDALAGRAVAALGAWRAARTAIDGAELRLAARSRELDLLAGLGRRVAEARDLRELFASTAAVLAPALDLDLVLAGWRIGGGEAEVAAFEVRPFAPGPLRLVERSALRFLGAHALDDAGRQPDRLEGWDEARSAGRELSEGDLLLLPLFRRGQPEACLVVVPSGDVEESRLRPLYAAASLLTLHVDRIVAMAEAEADRFRSIVEAMPQGVILADRRLRPLMMNGAAVRMLESVGGPAGDPRSALERAGIDRLLSPSAFESEPFEAELHPDGGRVWAVTASPFGGDGEAVVLVMADVTERRRIQERLAQAEKMSSLGQMISGVAHELNNPLTSILGYAQLLQLKGRDERLPERLELLAREAERCRKIVRSLLSFARARPAERRPLSLNQVVRDVHLLLAYQLRVADVTVELELEPELPVVHGDAHQLEQLLVNLLTNARHAIRSAGRPGTVRVSTRRAGPSSVSLDVGDDGPGIPPEILARVFDPFFTTKQAGEGTGLGLALVYSIVTAGHGGMIEVRSSAEGGTRFEILLPCDGVGLSAATPRMPPPEAMGTGDPASEESVDGHRAAPRRGRILVIDDEETLARLICEALEHDGHTAARVSDGRQALARVRGEEFDLVVSDVRMPGIEADRLHEELLVTNPRLARRMLLTTGDTLGPGAEEIAARTGLEVLAKPFDLADLRRRVHARLALED
jgi:signal transduction histidine kinase/ActR/RegA family two-component response regulator